MLDGLFQFSLKCFYDKISLNFLSAILPDVRQNQLPPLIPLPASKPNTTIEQLIKHLFVVEWIQTISFEKYFDECQPKICQYSNYIGYHFLYIVTFFIALFGGLAKGVHLVVSFLSIIVYKIIDWRKKKIEIAPNSAQSDRIEVIDEPAVRADQVNRAPFITFSFRFFLPFSSMRTLWKTQELRT